MSRFVVIVLDSFGVGAMDDVSKVRPRDIGSSTAGHIIETNPSIQLPTLEKLGLMNALGYEIGEHKKSETAVFGTSNLSHHGADSFLGHQEIMGTTPKIPLIQPFNQKIDEGGMLEQMIPFGNSTPMSQDDLKKLYLNKMGGTSLFSPVLAFCVLDLITSIISKL